MTVTRIVPCIATPERIMWALLRAGMPTKIAKSLAWNRDWTMRDAERLASAADIALAALYLPNPSHFELTRARLHGWRAYEPLWLVWWGSPS